MPHRLVVVEFTSADALVAAAARVTALGYHGVDAHSPFPIPALAAALATPAPRVPAWMLAGAIGGGGLGYLVQWWCTFIAYPIISGGFPFHPVAAFVPITFESAVLGSCLCGFLAPLLASGLPRLWHPLFAAPNAEALTRDRFALSIADSRADPVQLRQELAAWEPVQATAVEG